MIAYTNVSLWTKDVTFKTFMLFDPDKPQTTQTPQGVLDKVRMINAMLGGEDRTGNS